MTAPPHVCSHEFRHFGRTIRVTLTDPGIPPDGSRFPYGMPFVASTPPDGFTEPTPTFGVFCPASFSVEGLDVPVSFTIAVVASKRRPGLRDVGIESMTVQRGTTGGIDTEVLAGIPAVKLLASAIHAAGVYVMNYPAGYDGPGFYTRDDGTKAARQDMNIRVDRQTPASEIVGIRANLPTTFTVEVAGVNPVLDGDARLRRVADLASLAEADGQSRERAIADAFHVGDRQARRLIADARAAGLLPPVPETDKRGRRSTK